MATTVSSMATTDSGKITFETKHEDVIHDLQLDYFGKKLATCSSDRTIKIFDVSNTFKARLLEELKGHEGPVWQVAWAHPCFGNILASCSYDHKVIIWKEVQGIWTKLKVIQHESSVNSLSWGAYEFGLRLVSGCSDGCISVATANSNQTEWDIKILRDSHKAGCNAVSCSGTSENFVSGGGDHHVKIWCRSSSSSGVVTTGDWIIQLDLGDVNGGGGHRDWVRDVAWAPGISVQGDTIASGSQDGTVIIWQSSEKGGNFLKKKQIELKATVWRLSWSVIGDILAVTTADNAVSLWKEDLDGDWKNVDFNSNKK